MAVGNSAFSDKQFLLLASNYMTQLLAFFFFFSGHCVHLILVRVHSSAIIQGFLKDRVTMAPRAASLQNS